MWWTVSAPAWLATALTVLDFGIRIVALGVVPGNRRPTTAMAWLLCIFFLGGDSIRSFAFAMILGVVFGTLSSLFIAAPIAYRVMSRKERGGDVEA